ncbi:hypothetical protein F5I97DRAFT_1054259 [Phlebopus sp. FC_14]|nr:hypothetical protein F5I97DRAFT_1054259 [Phlebopus sp. FC_14]
MLLRLRRSTEPLQASGESNNIRRVSPRDTPRNRAASDGVFRRVSSIFNNRKRTLKSSPTQLTLSHGHSPVGFVRPNRLALSRTSSLSSLPSSPEIRRPSGLGRRASSLASRCSTEGHEKATGGAGLTKGSTSLPNLLDRPLESANLLAYPPTRIQEQTQRNACVLFPDELLEVVLLLLPRWTLPATALVSRKFCAVARHILYCSLDFQRLSERAVETLCGILANKRELSDQVVTLACHFWPTSSTDGNAPLTPSMDFLSALQNMRHLRVLTLQSFAFVLSHTPTLPFSLTKLTILDEALTKPQLALIRTWLLSQPHLESLAFPNCNTFTGLDEVWSAPGPEDSPMDTVQPAADQEHHQDFLPGLLRLHCPSQVAAVLCSSMKHPLQRITLNVHDTLYAGLRPSSVLRTLKGVEEMHVVFGHDVDKRTTEKFLGTAGGILTEVSTNGAGGLKMLEVEVSWVDEDAAETLYRIVTAIIPRLRGLQKLKITTPYRSVQTQVPMTLTVPLPPALPSPVPSHSSAPSMLSTSVVHGATVAKEFVACGSEKAYAKTWSKLCPSLIDIQFDFSAPSDTEIELCGVWFRRKVTNFRTR